MAARVLDTIAVDSRTIGLSLNGTKALFSDLLQKSEVVGEIVFDVGV